MSVCWIDSENVNFCLRRSKLVSHASLHVWFSPEASTIFQIKVTKQNKQERAAKRRLDGSWLGDTSIFSPPHTLSQVKTSYLFEVKYAWNAYSKCFAIQNVQHFSRRSKKGQMFFAWQIFGLSFPPRKIFFISVRFGLTPTPTHPPPAL